MMSYLESWRGDILSESHDILSKNNDILSGDKVIKRIKKDFPNKMKVKRPSFRSVGIAYFAFFRILRDDLRQEDATTLRPVNDLNNSDPAMARVDSIW